IGKISITLLDVLLGRNVACCAFSISDGDDKRIRPALLREKLVFHVGLARQYDQLCRAKIEHREIDALARIRAFAPAQGHGGEALLEWLFRADFLFEIRDRPSGSVTGFESERCLAKTNVIEREPPRGVPRGFHRVMD